MPDVRAVIAGFFGLLCGLACPRGTAQATGDPEARLDYHCGRPDGRDHVVGVRFPYAAGSGFGFEEDLAMSDRTPAPGDADDRAGSEPEVVDDDEFAKMAAVMRASEKHREGGVEDPDLDVTDAGPDPDA
jgi:hypothetical protein